MLFNSVAYLIYLPVCFIIYWFVVNRNLKLQNVFLLGASYVFYGWWNYRFLGLIILSTLVDYLVGLLLEKIEKSSNRKILLSISLVFNLGLLAYFKYADFFVESFADSLHLIGFQANLSSLQIILPVGISFYTFQTMSYTIDVYRKKLKPVKNPIVFATYVAFFPQLVAGPIERATRLLPQISTKRIYTSEKLISGFNLIIWGLFKKMVIADSCANYVNAIFDDYQNQNSLTLILGAVYFAFQIYGDFSGYSDIAIGTARLFGIELMKNFDYPYFSRNIAEFWRRWHISLSTWFRDYLYIPLGGSRGPRIFQLRNVFIIFLVSGFWHGANWTFLVWGFLHALLYVPLLLRNTHRSYLDRIELDRYFPSLREFGQIILTFSWVTLAWVFFRANTVKDAFLYLKRLFTNLNFDIKYLSIERYSPELVLIIIIFLLFEWFNRHREHPFVGKYMWFKLILIIFFILTLGVYSDHSDFIYFQF